MSANTYRGRVLRIGDTTTVGANSFRKRELTLDCTTNPQYPSHPTFEFVQDRVALLDALVQGQEVEVSFSLEGRSSTNAQGETKYFTTVRGFAVQVVSLATPQVQYQQPAASQPAQPATQTAAPKGSYTPEQVAMWAAAQAQFKPEELTGIGYVQVDGKFKDFGKELMQHTTQAAVDAFVAEKKKVIANNDDLPF